MLGGGTIIMKKYFHEIFVSWLKMKKKTALVLIASCKIPVRGLRILFQLQDYSPLGRKKHVYVKKIELSL